MFTSFFHALDNDLLMGKPAILAATAGTARHALVVDDQMRALFAYLRTMTVPTSLFAAPEDWSDDALNKRIDPAAFELVLLMESGFARKVRDESWENYQHEFGSAGGTEVGIDLDSDLMRLATGGRASSTPVRSQRSRPATVTPGDRELWPAISTASGIAARQRQVAPAEPPSRSGGPLVGVASSPDRTARTAAWTQDTPTPRLSHLPSPRSRSARRSCR